MTRILKKLSEIEQGQAPTISTDWFPIQFIPDLANDERLNIGVAIKTATGYVTRFIERYDRLRSAYGDGVVEQAAFLRKLVEQDFVKSQTLSSPNIVFGEPRAAFGEDIESIIEELMAFSVPLDRPMRDSIDSTGISLQTKKVRREVEIEIRKRAGDRAESIIAQNPSLEFKEGMVKHLLDVPLQGINRFGTVVSASSKKIETIQRNVSFAVQQVRTAAVQRDIKHVGIFLLRPSDKQFDAQTIERVDGQIDDLLWMLKGDNIYVEARETVGDLAQEVIDWGLN